MIQGAQAVALLALGQGSNAGAALGGGLGRWFWVPLLLGAVALCLLLPTTTTRRRFAGSLLGWLSLLLILTSLLVPLLPRSTSVIFWCLALVTVAAAVATITTTRPVYSVLWFALSLLGTAGLMLVNGAQFLSVSTAAVYAGAIVVTLLFVLMLAQPGGHAAYDRISWSCGSRLVAALVAAGLLSVLTVALRAGLEYQQSLLPDPAATLTREVLTADHVAQFGTTLYTRHLLSIELAGALLLIALVGTLSIMTRTTDSSSPVSRGTGS